MDNVITYLKALASGIGKQDEDTMYSFYAIAHNQLKTQAEREAFRYGTLAMLADVGKMRIRAALYRRKFRKAMDKLR
ncbi:hypothetical protein ACFFIS_04735 [Virgibacillus soli]|uniref:Uncharacterized protein n=1 Tax=Paracerasibacillus soli TaxID=480284 RepID=A0ABU5CUB5_9BACI|nr:hypothetical protein [Virgibacillus soli]MDY0409969.1 hypothetical protein [Virgibacillus soli]